MRALGSSLAEDVVELAHVMESHEAKECEYIPRPSRKEGRVALGAEYCARESTSHAAGARKSTNRGRLL